MKQPFSISSSSRASLASIFLMGPTASGKSELALRLAERLSGEIISVDSMQVYRGLDIGTAKPSLEERRRVTHHLVDSLDLDEVFDVSRFVHLARQAEQDIVGRGRIPIFCGGTGLYFKAYLEGLGNCPPSDPALRSDLIAQPLEVLCERLLGLDPEAYQKIDRQNPRRVIRALEVVLQSGKSLAIHRAAWSKYLSSHDGENNSTSEDSDRPLLIGLVRSPEELRLRIEKRVEVMFQQGLVEETRVLLERGLARNQNASQAIGYRQVMEHLEGARSLPETIALVKTRTRKYAKRQMTWFRVQLPVTWIEGVAGVELERQAAHLADLYLRKQQKDLCP